MDRGKMKHGRTVISILYVLLAATGLLLHDAHKCLIWLLLVLHCYTDCRDGTVYCFPTYICIVAEIIIYIIRLACGAVDTTTLLALAVCIGGIIFFSRVIHAYAAGDEEIYVMLVLAAANGGRDVLFYGIYILGCSGIIFVLYGLWAFLRNALIRKALQVKRQDKKEFSMEAPMLPAILTAYIMAELLFCI